MAEAKMALRDDHKQLTRDRILDAASELICERGEDQITIAQVAGRARVADRTVFRHFGSRANLVRSVWERLGQRIGTMPIPRNLNELIDAPLLSFPRFDDEQELLRAYLDTRRRRTGQADSYESRRPALLGIVGEQLSNLDERQRRRRAAIAELLTSADAWDRMSRMWGFDGVEAGDAAAEALQVLFGCYPADGRASD